MNTTPHATIVRLHSEHLQDLVTELTDKLVALEQTIVVDGSSRALPLIERDEISELSCHIVKEAERLQHYLAQIIREQGELPSPRPLL